MKLCPSCGEEALRKNGTSPRADGSRYQKYTCVNCGAHPTDYSHADPAAPGVTVETDVKSANTREVTGTVSAAAAPTTVDEWIELLEIDEDVWEITVAKAGRWEGFIKNAEKKIEKTPLFKFAVTLVRRRPMIESPTIRPVSITIPSTKVIRVEPLPPGEGWARALIIPDTHNGYIRDSYTRKLSPLHDRRAWSIALGIAEMWQPDDIILVGDCLDLAAFSKKFIQSPEFERTFQPTIVELAWLLAKLRMASPVSRIIYIEGNHEKRFREGVVMDMPELEGVYAANDPEQHPVLTVANYLGLDGLKIDWRGPYPKAHVQLNERMRIGHGHIVRKGSGATTRALLQGLDSNLVMGHTHRLEQASHTFHGTGDPRVYTATSIGTLAHIDGRVPSNTASENWQQGIAKVVYTPLGDESYTTTYPITSGRTVVDDEVITGEDYTEQLVDETEHPELSLSFPA